MPPAARKPAIARASSGSSGARRWDQPDVGPLVLIQGPEEYLRELATEAVVAKAREKMGDVDLIQLNLANYQPGDLAVAASPSLFAEPKVVVLSGLETAATADEEILSYLKDPNPDAAVIIVHGGGVRGKKVLDTLKSQNAIVIECAQLKKDAEKADFVFGVFKKLGRKAEPDAIVALLEATGSDLRTLASAAAQLSADVPGAITAGTVHEYHGGKVEATGFQIADAALSGDATKALTLLRHGLAIGLKGPELTGALSAKIRTLAKAAAVRSGEVSARDLGLQDWQLRNAYKDLNTWRPEQLAMAVEAVANADYLLKGGGTPGQDTEYALEKALLTVARRR